MNSFYKIQDERAKFIEKRGYAPDTLYCSPIFENAKGSKLFGMEIKISRFLDAGNMIMCLESDLQINWDF